MDRSTPGLPVHHQLPEFTQTHVHHVGDAIQPSHPLLTPSPPAPNPSQHQSLFRWVNSSHELPKYWSFSFSISPSKEHPGLISFRMDWLDLLAVQGTLKSLLQHHSSKASMLRCSAFFTVQLSQYSVVHKFWLSSLAYVNCTVFLQVWDKSHTSRRKVSGSKLYLTFFSGFCKLNLNQTYSHRTHTFTLHETKPNTPSLSSHKLNCTNTQTVCGSRTRQTTLNGVLGLPWCSRG